MLASVSSSKDANGRTIQGTFKISMNWRVPQQGANSRASIGEKGGAQEEVNRNSLAQFALEQFGERSLEQFAHWSSSESAHWSSSESAHWSGHLIAHWSEKGGGSSLERFSIAHWSCFEAKKLIGAVLQGAHWGGNQRGSNFFKRKTTGRMEKELR